MKALFKETSMPAKPISCATPTTNACKLCTPLGACLAFRGFEGCVPFLHGSQGCATYIRRYLISHYREPMDIASSSFSEQTVVFGGQKNLTEGLFNVIRQYRPEMIGIATTCLAETIGDDLPRFLHEFKKEYGDLEGMPALVPVSTPSYAGAHAEGFWMAARAAAEILAVRESRDDKLFGICPGMVSPADLRHLREIFHAFDLRHIMFPDYAETLDGGSWEEYMRMPPGGTPVASMRNLGNAEGLITFSTCMPEYALPGPALRRDFDTELFDMPLPIGVEATDTFFKLLSSLAGRPMPAEYQAERARLVDSYVDGHKITAGKRVAVFGEADFVVAMTAFLYEVGLIPVLCACGGKTPGFEKALRAAVPQLAPETIVRDDADYSEIEDSVAATEPFLLVGPSKGYSLSRRLGIPLLRVGFPIHDRIGGPRALHLGYRGAQRLYDDICNLIIEHLQDTSPVGYAYM
jgi:nitrogenase molybdenum-iron protein NifN